MDEFKKTIEKIKEDPNYKEPSREKILTLIKARYNLKFYNCLKNMQFDEYLKVIIERPNEFPKITLDDILT